MNEIENLVPYKTILSVSRFDGKNKTPWFKGLLTSISSRGYFIKPYNEDKNSNAPSVHDGILSSFIPFSEFAPECRTIVNVVKN